VVDPTTPRLPRVFKGIKFFAFKVDLAVLINKPMKQGAFPIKGFESLEQK
jgi:hypothetical protein